MTAPSSIDPAQFLHEHLSNASPDLLRLMLTTFINTLMSAEADAVCGAAYGQVSPERVNTRNGYRHRDFDTRAGTLDIETLGTTRLSKSQVRMMATELDTAVEAFRTRPVDAGPYTFLAADALVLKVREGGRVVTVHALLANAVNGDGKATTGSPRRSVPGAGS